MTAPRPAIIVRHSLAPHYYAQLCAAFPHVAFPVCTTAEEMHTHLPDAVALIGAERLTSETLAAAPNLRWLQVPFAGVDHFLTPEIVAHGITITNFSGVHVPNIPEHILALMFAFARQLRLRGQEQDRHIWHNGPDADPRAAVGDGVFELEGQTLGVVGMGDIGAALARKAHALGLHVLATRRHPGDSPAYVDRLLPPVALPELLIASDHVALCLPLTSETRGIIGAGELAQMKHSAYIYNIGRGELIAQDALIAALRAGTIAGAGLDVTTPEPLPADSPLWDMPNVLITGHTSGVTPNYWERGIVLVIENVRRFLANEPLLNVVNPAIGY